MKRNLYLAAAFAMMTQMPLWAQKPDYEVDSTRVYQLQQIEVTATRASKSTPMAYTDISQEQISRNNYGLDVPFVLQMTPSFIATSETGIGIGATSMRLRGTDASRLNVTANGVPINNPDSHAVYWYDTPDFISAVGTVQVQRGAGTSTHGTGAFGGALNMTTSPLTTRFGGDVSLSYGSFNTNKQAVHISSGLMGGHWIVDARLTHIGSDGYIDRGKTDLKSYMLQAGYYSGRTSVKLLSFGGKAKTYLTYTGVTKEDMELYGRRYHTEGQYVTSDGEHVLADGTHVGYYDDHTDNYLQINNQLIINHQINDKWRLNFTGFYTYGDGFYRQYKDNAKLLENGFAPEFAFDAGGSKIRKDLIREKLMRNHFGGFNASADYTSRSLDLVFGGSYSYYSCPHWGELDWVQDTPAGFTPGMHWYDNDVDKHDANAFVKAAWRVADGLTLVGDLQYRYVHYKAWGVNDNYDDAIDGMQVIDVDETYHFFNPKVGINYSPNKHHHLYASFAIAQKEPTRSDFTDRFRQTFPTSEKLYDYEIGYQYNHPIVSAGINLYYMYYKDQLVKTGQINESYDALNINVPKSYRRGIELSLAVNPLKWLSFGGNLTLSQNKIKDYVNMVVDYDSWDEATNFYGYHTEQMGDTQISYSPNTIANFFINFDYRGFGASITTQYVGDQYFTNYKNDNMKLDAYCVTNLNLSYTMKTRSSREVRFGVTIYNLFDAEYCNNGYGYSEYSGGEQTDVAYYFPQATIHALANITVNF